MSEEQQPQPEAEAPAEEREAKAEDVNPPLEEEAAKAADNPAPALPTVGGEAVTTVAEQRAAEAPITTPVASPLPPPRPLVSRRVLILGGFWSALMLAFVGILGGPLDFLFPRNVKGFGGPVKVSPTKIPKPGADPVRIVEGKFYLLNLEPGVTANGEETPGGLLALWQKCPHLGCTVPWRPEFTFAGRKGWFRCPCHGSTYTKEGGVRVFGPAPRSMDVFPIEVNDDGSLVVQTGPEFSGSGSVENPGKAQPYNV